MHAVVLAPGDDAVCCLPYLHLVLEAKAYCSFLREEWSKQVPVEFSLSLGSSTKCRSSWEMSLAGSLCLIVKTIFKDK